MPSFLLDEHLRGPLWRAIQRHNALGGDPIDAVRVGDPADLPLGSLDPDILRWAEREGRILVCMDRDTLVGFLFDHLKAGNHSPGVFVVRRVYSLKYLVDLLALVAHDPNEAQWRDQATYI